MKLLKTALFILMTAQLPTIGQNNFTLSHTLQNGMSLRFSDNGTSGGFNVNWTNLIANVYLDTTNQRVRIVGYASATQDVQQISYTTNRSVSQPFPNPPIQVTGTVTVRLALPTGGLLFDTGYQPLTWDQSIGQYTFNGGVLGTIPVIGSFTLVTGGKTYSTNFSYNLNAALGSALTFQRLSTTNYPQTVVVSGFGWTGGMFSYSVGVATAAQITADNGFPVSINPGVQMWGLFNGESFNWSFGAQQYLSGGAGIDYTPTSAFPGEAPLLPTIIMQPTNTTASTGGNASFSVVASGQAPLTYQWKFNGNPLVNGSGILGTMTNLLFLSNLITNQSGNYLVIVSNGYGASITSSVVSLTVTLPPPPPTVAISTYSNNPVIFFPTASGTNYVLQMTTNLSSPVWVTVTNGVSFSGIQITKTPGNAFFRLK